MEIPGRCSSFHPRSDRKTDSVRRYGEKLSDLEQFYPDRMASRILGMGDVLTMIEKAQENLDEEKAKELEQKMRKNEFDFEMYLESMSQMKRWAVCPV